MNADGTLTRAEWAGLYIAASPVDQPDIRRAAARAGWNLGSIKPHECPVCKLNTVTEGPCGRCRRHLAHPNRQRRTT